MQRPTKALMGKDDDKSGVSADDFGKTSNLAKVEPARANTTQSKMVGDRYIDHGALCEGKDENTPGCFLETEQRKRLIEVIRDQIRTAQENYKIALVKLEFEELMKKEADLNWAASLALDLIGAHVIKSVGKAIISLKNSGFDSLATAVGTRGLQDTAWQSRVGLALASLDEKTMESNTKLIFDPIKKGLVSRLKSEVRTEERTEKAEALSFMDQLLERCDVEFEQFKSEAFGKSDDAKLVVLWDGFKPERHTVGRYKEALGAKLDRFKKSGVTELGRKRARDRHFHRAEILRDTRVVWVEHDDGSKTLCYQSQEGDYNPNRIRRGDPGSGDLFGEDEKPLTFGARDPREDVRNEGRVPPEFVEVALLRSEQVWGPTPTIPDPMTAHLRAAKGKPSNMFVPQTQPKTKPSNMFVPQAQPAQTQPTRTPKSVEPRWDDLPDAFKTTKA